MPPHTGAADAHRPSVASFVAEVADKVAPVAGSAVAASSGNCSDSARSDLVETAAESGGPGKVPLAA